MTDITTQSPLTRQARKAETRRALIRAAGELFAEHGMERTSLDEIATRVGLTKGAIYANFRNKEELIDAVSDEFSQLGEGDALHDASLDIAERLAALGTEAAALMPQIQPINAMLHLEFDLYLQRHPGKAAQERALHRAWLLEEGRKLEATARERGELLPMSGATLWALLLGTVRGMAIEALRDPEAIPPEAVTQYFALLGRGFAAWSDQAKTAGRGRQVKVGQEDPG